MNAITRSDPSKEMEELQNRLSNFFGRTPARMGDACGLFLSNVVPLEERGRRDRSGSIGTPFHVPVNRRWIA
jgi:hypothetical protein